MDSDSDSDTPLVSYATTTPGASDTATIKLEPKVKGKERLKAAFGLVGENEWLAWLRSDMVKPHWLELWNDFLRNRKGGERGPGLAIVQARILSGEGCGNRKYSAFTRDKTEWDEADHYACFLFWVRHENTSSKQGVYFRTQSSQDHIDRLIWALKDWLRHIHAPSQIGKGGGGTAIFGTTRGQLKRTKSGVDKGKKAKLFSEGNGDPDQTTTGSTGDEGSTDESHLDSDTDLLMKSAKSAEEPKEADKPWDKWESALQEAVISEKNRICLQRQSPTFNWDDKFWLYALTTTALKNCERSVETSDQEMTMPTTVEETEEVVAGATSAVMTTPQKQSRKSLEAKYQAFDPSTTDVFDPEKYHVQEDLEYALLPEVNVDSTVMELTEEGLRQIEKQREWFDNKAYQRENHQQACANLRIPAESHPRLPSMHAGAMLKFWQPVAINALTVMAESGQLRGAILADTVGLGKTWEAIGFLMHQYTLFEKRYMAAKEAKLTLPLGRPMLIVVPPTLIGQWIGEISAMTDMFNLWVYYGDYRASAGHNALVINGKLTKQDEIFDGQLHRAKELVLTTYQTLTIRHGPSASKQWCEKRKLTYDPSQSPHGWDGCLSQLFSMAVFDEAHLLRNKDSQMSITAKWMNTSFNLLLTATPFFNGVHDFRGYIDFLFIKQNIKPEVLTPALFDLPQGHPQETLLLSNAAVERFVLANGVSDELAGTRLRSILRQLMVRRTISSSIPFVKGITIGHDIPGYKRKLIASNLDDGEELTYKALEIRYRRRLFIQDQNDPSKYRWNMDRLRKLTLFSSWLGFQWIASSLTTDHVPAALRCLREGTLVERWMEAVAKGKPLDVESSVAAFYRKAYKASKEAVRPTFNLEFLLRGSPKMRSMLPIIRDQVFLHNEKSIVWTMWPAEQVYIAACLNEIGIEAGVMHAALDVNERTKLIEEFTMQPEKCMVLISTYSISSAGLNLQKQCRNAHLFSPPTSQSVVNQAIGRVCRLGQTKIVLIYEYLTDNTFQCWLRKRGMAKALPGIITDLTFTTDDEEAISAHASLTRWRVRDGKLVYLEDGEEPQVSDVFEADRILEHMIESMLGASESC